MIISLILLLRAIFHVVNSKFQGDLGWLAPQY